MRDTSTAITSKLVVQVVSKLKTAVSLAMPIGAKECLYVPLSDAVTHRYETFISRTAELKCPTLQD
jgi:hypothetical protein